MIGQIWEKNFLPQILKKRNIKGSLDTAKIRNEDNMLGGPTFDQSQKSTALSKSNTNPKYTAN